MTNSSDIKNKIDSITFYNNEFNYPQLIPTGDNWRKVMALCPFHNDKKPGSFHINQETGSFKCFSCGEHGDLISFLMKRYNLNFKQAIIKLNERYL